MAYDPKRTYDRYWLDKAARGAKASDGERAAAFLSAIRPGGSMLDVGCGDGGFLKAAAPLFERACGTDISAAAVASVRAMGLEAAEGDVSGGLPFPGGSFDVCVCAEVIEHVPDPFAALKEIERVLRPGGQLLLSTPNVRCFRHIARLVFSGGSPRTSGDEFVWDGGHLHYFTRKDMARLLRGAGFTDPVFVLDPGQFKASWKRKLARLLAGESFFGEFVEGSIVAACAKGG